MEVIEGFLGRTV